MAAAGSIWDVEHPPAGMKSVDQPGPDQWQEVVRFTILCGVLMILSLVGGGFFLPQLFLVAGAVFAGWLVAVIWKLNIASKAYVPKGWVGVTLTRDPSNAYTVTQERLEPGIHRRWPRYHRRVFRLSTKAEVVHATGVRVHFGGADTWDIEFKATFFRPKTVAEIDRHFTARYAKGLLGEKDYLNALNEMLRRHVQRHVQRLGLDVLRDPVLGAQYVANSIKMDPVYNTDALEFDAVLDAFEFTLDSTVARDILGRVPFVRESERGIDRALAHHIEVGELVTKAALYLGTFASVHDPRVADAIKTFAAVVEDHRRDGVHLHSLLISFTARAGVGKK